MSEKRTPRTVRLPDPEGGPDLDMRGGIEVWDAIEEKWGGLGALYIGHRSGQVQFRLCCELVWRCARVAGSLLTLKQVSERCYQLGIHRLSEVVDQLWLDIMKPTEEPAAGGGDAPGVPLGSGD